MKALFAGSFFCMSIAAQRPATSREIVDYFHRRATRSVELPDAHKYLAQFVAGIAECDITLRRVRVKQYVPQKSIAEVMVPGMGFYDVAWGARMHLSLVYYPPGHWVDFYINSGPAYELEFITGNALIASFLKKEDTVATNGIELIDYAANGIKYTICNRLDSCVECFMVEHNLFYAVLAGSEGVLAVRPVTAEASEERCSSLALADAVKECRYGLLDSIF